MKKTEDMKKYNREYQRKYRLRPYVSMSDKSRQRLVDIKQRDIYITRLESVTHIIELEKRRQLCKSSMMRARKIETLEQKQVNIISKIDEYSEAIKMNSVHRMTKDK